MKIAESQLRKLIRKTILAEECWDGYSPGAQSGVKTKMGKSGKRVANCEKIREDDDPQDLDEEHHTLWDHIRAKRARGERPSRPGEEGYPSEKAWQSATEAAMLGEVDELDEAEYQGRKVKLNKPTAIRKGEPSYGKKQDKVYVKDGDKVKKVTFGDPNSRIRKSNPKARKSFRSRHNCDSPGPKTKARYWSCKEW